MIELTASRILNAIEGGDIVSIRDNGAIKILVDLKPVLIISEQPGPEVWRSVHNVIKVRSGGHSVATIHADSEADAEQIADALGYLLAPNEA